MAEAETRDDQLALDINRATSNIPKWPGDDIPFPTDEEVEAARQVREENERKREERLAADSIKQSGIIPPEPESQEANFDQQRIGIITHSAVRLYPDKFACKKDLTESKEKRIAKLCRSGQGMSEAIAFEVEMGYSKDVYDQLDEDPQYSFQDKSANFLRLAEKIFAKPYPPASHKKELRILRDEISPLYPEVEVDRLKGRFAEDDSSADLFDFINWRLKDINDLLNQ